MVRISCVLIVLLITDVCAVLDYCVFGAGCPFQCHCSPVQPQDDCDNMTGKCPETDCVKYQGEVEGTYYRPWYEPGCQLGDVGLEKVIYVYDLANNPLQIQYTIKTPYGNTDPLICLYPDAPFQLSDLQFVLDFEQTVYLVILAVNSKHETKILFDAYQDGTCQYKSYVSDSITDKSDELQCETIYPTYTDALFFACNKKGRYLIFTGQGCNLREHGVQNLCIEFVTTFGYPVEDVACPRCMKNDSAVMISNTQAYIEEFNDRLIGTSEENKTLSVINIETLPCGNGIWCEVCEAGWLPPDCRKPCPTGHYGVNCAALCKNLPVLEQYHCNNTHNCDHVTGEFLDCYGWCELWYTGIRCTDYIVRPYSSTVVSSIRSGHNHVSFFLDFEVDDKFAQYYSYTIEYSETGNQPPHLYPAILLPTAETQLIEFTGLEPGQEYSFRIIASRQDQGLRESVISDAFKITTGCLPPPQVDIYDQTDLYISWHLNETRDLCGQVEVNGVLVKQSTGDSWKKYTVSTDIRVLLLQNMADSVNEIRLQGDSSLGYEVVSQSVLVASDIIASTSPGTTQHTQFDSFKSWNLNYLVILLLALSGILSLVLIVLIICVCRKTRVTTSQQKDIKMDYITPSQPGPIRYVHDPAENQRQVTTPAEFPPPQSADSSNFRPADYPPTHSTRAQDDNQYAIPYQEERPAVPRGIWHEPRMPPLHGHVQHGH